MKGKTICFQMINEERFCCLYFSATVPYNRNATAASAKVSRLRVTIAKINEFYSTKHHGQTTSVANPSN